MKKKNSIIPNDDYIKKEALMDKHQKDFYNLIKKTKHSNSKFKIKICRYSTPTFIRYASEKSY